MTRIDVAFVSALALVSSTLFAAGPDADPGEVQILMGKTVYVSLDPQADGKITPMLLDAQPKSGPFISFALSVQGGNRMLVVTNKYDKALSYKARMCMRERRLCANTSVLPVLAGIMSIESWGDPIDTIVVSALALK